MKAIDFREGYEVSIDHAIRLAQDADLLAENGSFGHAFFLYFTAMEEVVKAVHYALVYADVLEYDEKVKRDIMKHMDKTAMFAGFLVSQTMMKKKDFDTSPKMPTREELVESFSGLAEIISEFRRLRETSLYVDLKNNKWSDPTNFPEADFNDARKHISELISVTKQKFDILINTPKKTLEDIVSSMTPIFAQVVLLSLEKMFEGGILNEEEYKKLKTDIEYQIVEMKKQKRGYRVFWYRLLQG
jgi:AbiV family abortive infection protein